MGKADNRFTIQLSDDQLAMAKECMRRERYRSLSEVFASFIRHWALTQQPHTMTGPWAALEPDERDLIDQHLRRLVEENAPQKGSWLNARIYELIKEIKGPEATTPTVKQIAAKLPEHIRKHLSD